MQRRHVDGKWRWRIQRLTEVLRDGHRCPCAGLTLCWCRPKCFRPGVPTPGLGLVLGCGLLGAGLKSRKWAGGERVNLHLLFPITRVSTWTIPLIFPAHDEIVFQEVGPWCRKGLGDSQESSPTPQFKSINSLVLSFLYSPTLTFQRGGMGREVGGRFRMGNACKSMADSCQCMAKITTIL